MAGTAPAPANAPASSEPANLRELHVAAKEALRAPNADTHLRWVFWLARALGRLEVARAILKRLETADWEGSMRAAGAWPSQTHMDACEARRPGKAELQTAQEMVIEAVAFAEAARSVVELLARAALNGGRR